MKIVSLNLNGLRAAARKGCIDWMASHDADVFCLQETRIQPEQLQQVGGFPPVGWHSRLNSAQKKGYAGTAICAKRQPDAVLDELGAKEFDDEGRYLEYRFGKLSVISLYLPSGSSNPDRQASKDRFLELFLPRLREWRDSGRDYVLCGDWNIAHTEKDLKNWKANRKNSGFLPHERAWLDTVFDELGWVDAFRRLHPEAEGDGYTWWSNRGQARAKNVGWRIDYQIVSPGMAARLRSASVYKDERYSDHAPLIVDYAD